MRIPWKMSATEVVADLLRFVVWGGLVTGVISLSVFVAWFAANFFWHLSGWSRRVVFGEPW